MKLVPRRSQRGKHRVQGNGRHGCQDLVGGAEGPADHPHKRKHTDNSIKRQEDVGNDGSCVPRRAPYAPETRGSFSRTGR